ncbi:MAG: YggU family protein [Nautilia sp.]|nr:MAG: YggU family protein [Nautilia sp.]
MFKIEDNRVSFKIKAQPNSSINKIAGIYDEESIKINIKAPAVEGAANKELIKFLSKQFKIPKNEIEIKGETSKRKTISMPLNEKVMKFIEGFK